MKDIKQLTYKLLLLVLIAYVSSKIFRPISHPDILTIAGVLSTVSGILFGFVLAAISIFSSAGESKDGVINALKRNNILPAIIKRLLSTGYTLIVACLLPMLAMFLAPETKVFGKSIDYVFILLGFSALMLSLVTFTSCWYKLRNIFPHL